MDFDIIIVGAGVSGMTAAIYALRNGKSVLLLEGESVGGQAALSPKIENFPTHRSISGAELVNKLFEQVLDLGAYFELETVESVEKNPDGTFTVKTDACSRTAKAVIVANGVKQRHLPARSEKEFLGKGVYYCAICDGAFYKGKDVAVIGDGNSALQTALSLSEICNKVYVLTLTDKYFGDQANIDLVNKTENVETITNVNITDFLGKDELVAVRGIKDNDDFLLKVPAVFVAIGLVPDNQKFSNVAKLSDDGYFLVDESMQTSTEGLFAAGDTRNKKIRQLTTAVSDGAIAATSAVEYIRKL